MRSKRKVVVFSKIQVPVSYIDLHDECWKLHSEIVRRTEKGICFTCGERGDWKNFDCGHYKHGCLDFDRRNTHCQCRQCNQFKGGNLAIYELKLVERYGPGIIAELEKAKWQTPGPTYQELLKLKAKLEAELNKLNEPRRNYESRE